MININHIENTRENQKHFNEHKKHFSKQCSIVLEALQRGERLTTVSALIKYKVGDLRRRIKDLRDYHKVNVQSSFVNGSRYKEYYLNLK